MPLASWQSPFLQTTGSTPRLNAPKSRFVNRIYFFYKCFFSRRSCETFLKNLGCHVVLFHIFHVFIIYLLYYIFQIPLFVECILQIICRFYLISWSKCFFPLHALWCLIDDFYKSVCRIWFLNDERFEQHDAILHDIFIEETLNHHWFYHLRYTNKYLRWIFMNFKMEHYFKNSNLLHRKGEMRAIIINNIKTLFLIRDSINNALYRRII